jgi:hypothetical protein
MSQLDDVEDVGVKSTDALFMPLRQDSMCAKAAIVESYSTALPYLHCKPNRIDVRPLHIVHKTSTSLLLN